MRPARGRRTPLPTACPSQARGTDVLVVDRTEERWNFPLTPRSEQPLRGTAGTAPRRRTGRVT
uniref:Putative topoisomerase IA n=1 Tax=Streptomyces lividus TaxID=282216 RepID=Q2MF53_STRLV|nr:putative topoisomerase IA fragment [Streptomyces lividus]